MVVNEIRRRKSDKLNSSETTKFSGDKMDEIPTLFLIVEKVQFTTFTYGERGVQGRIET